MQHAFRVFRRPSPVAACGRAGGPGGGRLARLLALWLLAALAALPVRAATLELREVRALLGEDGVQLSFAAHFALPRVVEDALLKGVPLYFVAEARVYRSRWYWRDRQVAGAMRSWRLSYQPLTRRYRVNFGSLGQNYDALPEALGAIHRTIGWKIAEPERIRSGERHYVELDYRLDTSQLPRPFQIGIGGQADWQLEASETVPLQDVSR
ncbi:DUF4390 domain-containing protein [Caldimonas tepidiphila]|uniref:DUF4390 domain-containing protein n=1 Tax=Caldimonas tepidiphila TaxID=2315841 RepID=UPI001F0B875C|nr:DUF4390 domain-containing protein [Caldimonas tepidiphila]